MGPDDRCSSLARLVESYATRIPVKRIAVVGNAPLSSNVDRARRIDSADLVVRMTTFRLDTASAQPSFGTKTDVVMLHRGTLSSPFTFAGHASRLYLLVEPGRRHWEPATLPHWWPLDLGLVHLPNDLFSETLVDRLGLSRDKAEWATTGTLAVWTMRRLFPAARLELAGFTITDDPAQTHLTHSWGAAVPLTAEHDLYAESSMLGELEREGALTRLA